MDVDHSNNQPIQILKAHVFSIKIIFTAIDQHNYYLIPAVKQEYFRADKKDLALPASTHNQNKMNEINSARLTNTSSSIEREGFGLQKMQTKP